MKIDYGFSLFFALFLVWGCTDHYVDPTNPPAVAKKIYIPREFRSMNLNNDNSEWSYARSAQSDNFIMFWQKGFGIDPQQTADSTMRFDVNTILATAEKAYKYNRETLQFAKANTRMDSLKTMIFVYYTKSGQANASGYDNIIGALWMNPVSLRAPHTLTHEIGHTFQYQIYCDGGGYGFRDKDYTGTFWEQSSQYMARQLYPDQYLDDLAWFVIRSYYNFSHESLRYQSFHLLEYWKQKRGVTVLGRIWKEAVSAEHPLETYRRIYNLSQTELNDEIGDYAMHCMNWDFPNGSYVREQVIKSASSRIPAEFSTDLTKNSDGSYQVTSTVAPQCYGFNAIPLTLPAANTKVDVAFQGLNSDPFASLQGWRYGLVAVNEDGQSVYSSLGKTQQGSISIITTSAIKKLYLVVTGAPQQHFNHTWGLAAASTPKFPYKVSFINTQPK